MQSIFLPISLPEAERTIAMLNLATLGIDLIPIPADGGCVVVIRDAPRRGTSFRFSPFAWIRRLSRRRARIEVVSALKNAAVLGESGRMMLEHLPSRLVTGR